MPAYELRDFSGSSVPTTLTAGLGSGSGDLAIAIAANTGWPDAVEGPFIVTVDRGLANEEKVLIASRSGLNLTAAVGGRGHDGTAISSHNIAAVIEHTFSARDAQEANSHIANVALDHHTQYLTSARLATALTAAGISTSLARDHNYWRNVGSSRFATYYAGYDVVSTDLFDVDENFLYATPFLERRGGTLDRLVAYLNDGYTTGNMRIGVYANVSSTDLYPGALVVDGGEVAITGVGLASLTISQALSPDTMYWLAATHNGSGVGGFHIPTGISANVYSPGQHGLSALLFPQGPGLKVARAYAALPNPFTAGAVPDTAIPLLAARYSA